MLHTVCTCLSIGSVDRLQSFGLCPSADVVLTNTLFLPSYNRHGAYTLVWLLLYLAHVAYLSLYRFDYGYNMAASVAAGTLYTAIWLFWCAKVGRSALVAHGRHSPPNRTITGYSMPGNVL